MNGPMLQVDGLAAVIIGVTMLRLQSEYPNIPTFDDSVLVWAIWADSGTLKATLFPPEQPAREASLQFVTIGVMLCLTGLFHPTGLFGNLTYRHRSGLEAQKSS